MVESDIVSFICQMLASGLHGLVKNCVHTVDIGSVSYTHLDVYKRQPGMSCRKIATTLNEEGIPTPATYCGWKVGTPGPYTGLWSSERISAMLRNETYIGNMAVSYTHLPGFGTQIALCPLCRHANIFAWKKQSAQPGSIEAKGKLSHLAHSRKYTPLITPVSAGKRLALLGRERRAFPSRPVKPSLSVFFTEK